MPVGSAGIELWRKGCAESGDRVCRLPVGVQVADVFFLVCVLAHYVARWKTEAGMC